MPQKIGDEELPTIDELEPVPKKAKDKDNSEEYMDSLFKDGDIYGENS